MNNVEHCRTAELCNSSPVSLKSESEDSTRKVDIGKVIEIIKDNKVSLYTRTFTIIFLYIFKILSKSKWKLFIS